jgi:hypothetical protein
MMKRNSRVEMKMSLEERAELAAASERKSMTEARYVRECVLAVARGRVIPADWLEEALEMVEEIQGKLAGVAAAMPPGWSEDVERRLDDLIHVGACALAGEDPYEGG